MRSQKSWISASWLVCRSQRQLWSGGYSPGNPGDFRLPKYQPSFVEARGNSGPEDTLQGTQGISGYLNINHHLLESEARDNSGLEGTRQGTQGTSGYLNINHHLLESEARDNSGLEGTSQGTQGTSGYLNITHHWLESDAIEATLVWRVFAMQGTIRDFKKSISEAEKRKEVVTITHAVLAMHMF
jgi:hypothetical protein